MGLPNIGKSSMFNLLSKLNVPAENYPFCTIDPSIAKSVAVRLWSFRPLLCPTHWVFPGSESPS